MHEWVVEKEICMLLLTTDWLVITLNACDSKPLHRCPYNLMEE